MISSSSSLVLTFTFRSLIQFKLIKIIICYMFLMNETNLLIFKKCPSLFSGNAPNLKFYFIINVIRPAFFFLLLHGMYFFHSYAFLYCNCIFKVIFFLQHIARFCFFKSLIFQSCFIIRVFVYIKGNY